MNHKRKRSENLYEVQRIVGKKTKRGEVFYKIKWKGYSMKESTWEPFANLANVKDLISKYEKRMKAKEAKAANEKEREKETKAKTKMKKRKIEKKSKSPVVICPLKKDEPKVNEEVKSTIKETEKRLLIPHFEMITIDSIDEYRLDEETTKTDEGDFLITTKPIITERITELEPFGNDIIALVIQENEKKQRVDEKAINVSELRQSNPGLVIDYFVTEYLQRQTLSTKKC